MAICQIPPTAVSVVIGQLVSSGTSNRNISLLTAASMRVMFMRGNNNNDRCTRVSKICQEHARHNYAGSYRSNIA